MTARSTLTADDLGIPCLGLGLLGCAAALLPATGSAALPAVAVILGLLAGRVVLQDLTDFTIPDAATLALAAVGAAWRLSEGGAAGEILALDLALIALDGLLCGGALLLLREAFYRSRGYDGIGLGDVKLAAAGGLLVGTGGFAWTLLSASLIGIVVLTGRRSRPEIVGAPHEATAQKLAFGAVLAPALWLAWLAMALGLGLG